MKLDTEKRIEMFLAMREIPYAMGISGRPDIMMKTGRGNCTSKHLKLGMNFMMAGFSNVMIGSVRFNWADLPIPREILTKLGPDMNDIHSILMVDGISVDATWDSGLEKFGFPVFNWDGVSATGIGVNPIGEVQTYELKYLLARVYAGGYIDIMRKIIRGPRKTPFNDAVNAWLGRSI